MSEFTAPSIEELQYKFPGHRIDGFIAQGGMGAVYLATQTSLDRQVAIKILPKEFGDDKDYRISFETEAKAMAKLNHPNLVGIYDFGDMDGMLFIVMEYIPGRSLYSVAKGQAVEQLEAANLINEMCHGLAHAHSSGLLHRDIKPANVLIDDEGEPNIVDFGLVRPLGEEQTEGVVFGTPGYTAPEVLHDPGRVDQRSDIFSMGVMLFELLTAKLPDKHFVTASELSQSDVRFDHIIAKAIDPDPNKRYHTAGQMSEALEDLMQKFDDAPGGLSAKRKSTVVLASAGNPVLVTNNPDKISTLLGVRPARALAPVQPAPKVIPSSGAAISSRMLVSPSTTRSLGSHRVSSITRVNQLKTTSGGGGIGIVLVIALLLVVGVAIFALNGGLDQFQDRPIDTNTDDSVDKIMQMTEDANVAEYGSSIGRAIIVEDEITIEAVEELEVVPVEGDLDADE